MKKEKKKHNIYEEITKEIVMSLAQGDIPWHKRWCTPFNGKINYISRRSYTGINLLHMHLKEPGEYLTYKQCEKLGGYVNKGEHGHIVYQWFSYLPKNKKEEFDRLTEEGKNTDHLLSWEMNYVNVFHLSQTTGIPTKIKTVNHEEAKSPTDKADYVIEKFKICTGLQVMETQSDSAEWDCTKNIVHIPSRKQFCTEEQFYNTLFGLLAKAALQQRKENSSDGNDGSNSNDGSDGREKKTNPVKDELSCEIAACMVMSGVGLEIPETKEDTLATCSKWSKALNKDFYLIVGAATQASKIAEMILTPLI